MMYTQNNISTKIILLHAFHNLPKKGCIHSIITNEFPVQQQHLNVGPKSISFLN